MPISLDGINSELTALSNRLAPLQKDAGDKLLESAKDMRAALDSTIKELDQEKGGMKSLTQEIDNAVQDLETISAPIIGKMTENMKNFVSAPELEPVFGKATEVNNIISTIDVKSIVSAAGDALSTAAEMLEDVFGSIDAKGTSESLKQVLGKSEEETKKALQKLTSEDRQDAIDKITETIKSGQLQEKINQDLEGFNKALEKSLGGTSSGNLMKDIIENKTGELKNVISSLSTVIDDKTAIGIKDQLFAGDITKALNSATSKLTIDQGLKDKFDETGILLDQSSPDALKLSMKRLENVEGGLSDALQTSLNSLKNNLSKVESSIQNTSTNVSSTVQQTDPTVGTNGKEAIRPSEYPSGEFPILNSRIELVKYFLTCDRDVTQIIWHWTNNYIDQYHIGAEELDAFYQADGFSEIPYHFIIKRDGTIQAGRKINTVGGHAKNFNEYTIGIAFVAGFNCPSTTGLPEANKYISAKSITQAQYDSMDLFLTAAYKRWPGIESWGHRDLPNNNNTMDPGFDVAAYTMNKFGQQNFSDPQSDGRSLSRKQMNLAVKRGTIEELKRRFSAQQSQRQTRIDGW